LLNIIIKNDNLLYIKQFLKLKLIVKKKRIAVILMSEYLSVKWSIKLKNSLKYIFIILLTININIYFFFLLLIIKHEQLILYIYKFFKF